MILPPGSKIGRIISLSKEEAAEFMDLNSTWKSLKERHDNLADRMHQARTIFEGKIYGKIWELNWESAGVIVFDEEHNRIVELLAPEED